MPLHWPRLNSSRIPARWSNDWALHTNCRERWHDHYGGMRWWFNDVLHIPGDPILLLFLLDDNQSDGGDLELVEVDGYFFLHDVETEHTRPVDAALTLEAILATLSGGDVLKRCPVLRQDLTAWTTFILWHEAIILAQARGTLVSGLENQ